MICFDIHLHKLLRNKGTLNHNTNSVKTYIKEYQKQVFVD